MNSLFPSLTETYILTLEGAGSGGEGGEEMASQIRSWVPSTAVESAVAVFQAAQSRSPRSGSASRYAVMQHVARDTISSAAVLWVHRFQSSSMEREAALGSGGEGGADGGPYCGGVGNWYSWTPGTRARVSKRRYTADHSVAP
jgi:hypothetical protein